MLPSGYASANGRCGAIGTNTMLKGETMSASRKLLKIISLLTILSGISYIVMAGILAVAGIAGGGESLPDMPLTAELAALILIVVAAAGAITNLLTGFLGLRGANVPSKIMPAYVLSICALIVAIINVIVNIALGGLQGADFMTIFNMVYGVACPLVVFILCNNVKKERELWH